MTKYDKPWIHRHKKGWVCESSFKCHHVQGYGRTILGAYNSWVTDHRRVTYALKKGLKP